MERSKVLANQIERPGKRELKQILSTEETGPRNLLRGVGAVVATPYFAAKDMMGKKLSDEEKSELKREVTRGNKGEDEYGTRPEDFKKGGKVKKYAKGGCTCEASHRGDGIAIRGKTRGKFV
jgi:hypothetical protein